MLRTKSQNDLPMIFPKQEGLPFYPLPRSVHPSQLHLPRGFKPTAYGFFRLFLSDQVLNLICAWTNQNAESQRRATGPSRSSPWQPLTNKELLSFFGIELYMADYFQTSKASYWSIKTPQPIHQWLLDLMPRNRFEQIWQYLRFQDPETMTSHVFEKVYQINLILSYLI